MIAKIVSLCRLNDGVYHHPSHKKLSNLIERAFPTEFLTTYDMKTGIVTFETQDRWILKLLSKLMNVYSLTVHSTRCFRTWGRGKEMHHILDELRLTFRPEKTFIGRNYKGFDLLRYRITSNDFSPNQKTQKKTLEKTKQRYAQGGKPLHLYLNRWRTWAPTGFPFKVQSVETIVASMAEKVTAFGPHSNSQRITNSPNISVFYGPTTL